jgi:hypothetical protein
MTSAAPVVNSNTRVIPGRECGSCSLCCKVYNIPEINKVAGKWCTHCKPGKGCVIHDALPTQCIEFNCLWRTEASIGPDWKPDRSKMVVTISPVNGYINVQVDSGAPQAWRKQPYYGQLHQWARNIVFVEVMATLIMPDQDVPIGPMNATDGLAVRRNGNAYEVRLIPAAMGGPPAQPPG